MKKIFFQVLICLLTINLLTVSVFAEIFYVRPAGKNYGVGDGSSYENAWDGFAKIRWGGFLQENGKINPGDTLYICGIHKETLIIDISGQENKSIVIRGDYAVEKGVIDGADLLEHAIQSKTNKFVEFNALELKNTHGTSFDLYNSGHESDLRQIKIEKCIISHAKKSGVMLTGDNVSIEDCKIFDIGLDGIYARGAYLHVTGCNIYNVAQEDLGDCIQLSTRGKNCYIAHNTLKNLGANAKQCIIVHGEDRGGIIEYNSCEISTASNRSHFPIQIMQRQIEVRYNMFKGGNYCGIFFNGRIYYNVFQDATAIGVRIASDNEVEGAVELFNNDIINSPTGLYHDSSVNLLVKNNIFYNCSQYGIKVTSSGKNTFISSHNCLYKNGANFFGVNKGSGTILADPGFEDFANNKFQLRQNSPCVNSAVRIENLNQLHDLAGLPISENELLDIGAFERTSAHALVSPGNLSIR